ncbi:HAD family hydrolase [Frankia sp. EI5c]|uniref:HAD family hydrolase n=1 Tax=Frankia sp. EI5c TaxID=683316 RepID=UPI001F5B4DD6|nr:HAD family hydrolase [Frankia sp. EI5c]
MAARPGPGDRRQLEAVVFDWGGTLTPFHDVDLLDLWRMAALEISPGDADEITAILAGLEAAWWHSRDDSDGLSGNGAAGGMTGAVAELLAAASARLGVDVAAAVLRATSRRDLTAWTPHTVCDPEALLLLHLVRARGLLVGLLTNTRWPRLWHERLLERDGLLDLFHARVYTSDLPFDKPHPIAFQAVLDALGLADPSRVLFVGDRVRTDIRGARAAGMRTVLVADGGAGRRPGGPEPTDAVIGRLGQLLEVLDVLGAAPPGTPPPR